MSSSSNDLVAFFQEHWYEKHGLVIALITSVPAIEGALVAASAPWWLNVSVAALAVVSISFAWWVTTRPPRTPKDKVGFLVSISCGDDAESEKLREDFIVPLHKLIKSGGAGSAFHFMQLPMRLARQIVDHDEAQKARSRSRAHFMLYGQVRLRPIGGKQHHVIDLDGMVAHGEVPSVVAQALAREFAELMPRKVTISTENDLLSFQFTSEWADIVAKYIIGISAAISGDLAYAETLYSDVQERLKSKDKNFPIYQKLSARLPDRVSELYECRANGALDAWTKDHQSEHVDELCKYLTRTRDGPQSRVHHLKAIAAFLARRDVDAALGFLKQAKNLNDGIWHYNMAFLYGYKGNLKTAARHYKQAALHAVEPLAIAQIEEFIVWVAKSEPEKFHLNYCLGMFNWKAKGDLIQSRSDFETFIRMTSKELFIKEQELATQWISDFGSTSTA